MDLPRDLPSLKQRIKQLLENLNTPSPMSPTKSTFKNPLGLLCKNICNDVSTMSVDKDDSIDVHFKSKFWEARWTVCEDFLSSEDAKTDLSDEMNRKLRAKLRQKLRGITVSAEKAQRQPLQFEGSVVVEHGTVVAIYGAPNGSDDWVGFILCKHRVREFRREHFQNVLPLPLQCDDKVSFLVQKTNQRTVLPGSVRVTEYCNKIGPRAREIAESFIQQLQARCDLILYNKQASALFAKLLFENDALQSSRFIEGVLMAAVAFIVIRFPVGSEGERETNDLFACYELNNSSYINPVEQKRFLSFFKGSAYPNHLIKFCKEKIHNEQLDVDSVVDILYKAIFMLFALVKEFSEEAQCSDLTANIACLISKEVAPFTEEYEVGMRLMHLLLLVASAPPCKTSWRSIPALLTVEEFHKRVHEEMPPVAEVKATYRDVEEYFDTYYKLLREDAYRSLFRSVRRYLEMDEDKLNQKNDAIYQIRFVEVIPSHRHLFNLCRVEWEPLTDAVKQEGGENSLYLHEGNLFCVSASGKFDREKPGDALFAVKVSEHPSEGHKKGILLKFLPAECNGISEVDAIEKLSRCGDNAVMIESPVFYRAYEPVLTALKAMDAQQFPFKSEVLLCKPCPLDDEYLPRDKKTVDVSPFQSVAMVPAKGKLCHVSDVHEELETNSILDETQRQAVNLVLNQRLAIIQGPPGTGKTFLTARIIQSLLNVQKQQTPIVIMAYKNRVLDQLISMCVKFCRRGKIIRLGRLSEDYHQESDLQACLLSKQPTERPVTFSLDCLHKSVAGMWKDWKETLTLQPHQITLSACLEVYKKETVQLFFEIFSDINAQELMQDLNGPLRGQADKIFMEKKEDWLHSLQQNRTQKNAAFSGNKVAEDEDKERERLCDTENDNFTYASDDEETEAFPIDEARLDYLEVKEEFKIKLKEGTMEASDESLHSFFNCLADELHERAKERLRDALNRIEEVTKETEGKVLEANLGVLREAEIVAMTTSKACIENKLLHLLQPEMIVIEEAGGILEPNVIACLTPKTKHLILVGDYKQIGPTVVSQELKEKKGTGLKNFSASLMERLVDPTTIEGDEAKSTFPFVCLDTQSRMNPKLLPLFKEDYADRLRTRREILPLVAHPKCMPSPLLWWSYPNRSGFERSANGRIWNELEAKMAATYCYWLYSEGFNPWQIAILSPYRAQVDQIKGELCNCRQMDEFVQSSVFTVDEFQGHERDIIVLSLVRHNRKSNVGFLKDRTRQVVALSRQKRALCIIGCHPHFNAHSPSWKRRIKAFTNCVLETVPILGREVQNPQDLMQLVKERLENGRSPKPLYCKPPVLPEEIGLAEVKDHGNNPANAQMPIVGERSTGNVINLQIQHTGGDVHVSINQDQLGVEEQPDVGSNEKLLKKWKGSKLVKGSEWDELRSSVCLIDCEDGTGTGFIGEKCGNLYLVTCWHNFEENDEETFLAKDILKTARKCKLHFSYTIKKDRPEWCMRGSDLLLNKRPIGKKEFDLVALYVNEEALRRLPGQIHPVPLSAMRYIRNRQGRPEEAWKDYYVTIVGFPGGNPLTISSGRIKGEKEKWNKYLLYHDADTEGSSSGSPVVVAEKLQTQRGTANGLAVIALHTRASDKKPTNIATILTPLVEMLGQCASARCMH